MQEINGTFGAGNNNTWQPWEYQAGVEVAKEFKLLLAEKTMSEKMRQYKITELIALKTSRRKFSPLVREIANKAHVEPLHLKNNYALQLLSGLIKRSYCKVKSSIIIKEIHRCPKRLLF